MAKEQFLTNTSQETFLFHLQNCFKNCKSFLLTVSFIKDAGMVLIEKDIEDALKRGVEGRIITSTYQNFTDIPSLNKFLEWSNKYPNFKCKIDFENFDNRGYHSKGYIFQMEEGWEFLVGSTNITRFALMRNIEWNVSIKLKNEDQLLTDITNAFDSLWDQTTELTNQVISLYTKQLEYAIERWDMDVIISQEHKIAPNSMQRNALKELRRYRDMGVTKSLVIASTGSGKTYLAAFDARQFKADRLLFIVHRDTILYDAMNTFKKVFKADKTYGIYNGDRKDIGAKFLFATNVTIAKNLEMFDKNEFDYIVMDECHHAAASTYQKIMNYFTPEFMLGLTATPERMDKEDIFQMFDKNVPYELRLRDAILNDLVVPFHYYGIRDEEIDYSDSKNNKFALQAYTDSHVNFISEQIQKYKPKHEKLKAIAFCRDVEHATNMAIKMRELGYSTCRLTGSSDTGQRLNAYSALQDENNELEIIFTVDILNEGIDIPAINMVLFLRPTQSQTIFIQQLGRGLRKYQDKPFLTVLDFIGNSYQRSVQVALALGSLTSNAYLEKPLLDSLVRDNFKSLDIPGVEIHLEQKSIDEILKYIDKTNFNTKSILTKDYENFKKYVQSDKYPTHLDYLNANCAPDLVKFLKSSTCGHKNRSYYNFLKSVEEPEAPVFDDDQVKVIDAISEILPITRKEEYLILRNILNKDDDFESLTKLSPRISDKTLKTAFKFLLNKKIIVKNNDNYEFNCSIDDEDFANYMDDLLSYGLERYDEEFGDFLGKFALHRNYQNEQINVEIDGEWHVYQQGTRHDVKNKETYIYVGLNKDKKKQEEFNYEDKFLSPNIFQWSSVNGATLTNAEGRKLLNSEKVYIFIRKVANQDGISMPFTYFGTGKFLPNPIQGTNNGNPILLFQIKLDNPVPKELWYDFLVPAIEDSDDKVEA